MKPHEGTLYALVDRYIRGRVERSELTVASAKTVRYALYDFAACYGNRPVERLGRSDVERWMASQKGNRPATRRGRLSNVKGFCRWLVREKKIKRDPTTEIARVRQPRTVPKVFTVAEVASLLGACPDARARLIVLLMFQLGLRCIEISRLEIGDIGERHVKVTGKGMHERNVFLVPQVGYALQDYFTEERGGVAGPLIANRTYPGTFMLSNTISKMVGQWVRDAGLKQYAYDGRSAHGGRRTAATDMLDHGATIEQVAEVLGHADLSSVRLYAKVRADRLEKAMSGRWYGSRMAIGEVG